MRKLLLAVVPCLVLPASAEAHRYSPVQAAYTVAARYWHQQPCGGHIKVVESLPPANDANNTPGAKTGMWASWNTDTTTENDELAPLPFSTCTIGINVAVWRSARQEGEVMWPDFAIMMIHEFGHLLGRSHSTDSASVMFPAPSDQISITGEYAPGWG